MSHKTINLNINGTDFEAEVEFTPALHVPAKLFDLPENCHPDESEDMEINELYMLVNVCGMNTKQDVSFLIDSLEGDIKEQLSD